MRSANKIIALLMALLLAVGLLPQPVYASESAQIHVSYHYDNPLYHDAPAEKAALLAQSRAAIASDADITDAASTLRQAIQQRQEVCRIQIQTSSYEEESFRELIHTIAVRAEAHTGVPTQGDYIMWQYGGWDASASGSSSNGIYTWTLEYTYSYYTTAQEEAQVTTKVNQVLSSLNVNSASDYEKIKAIYDYICANVTYDHDHLNDQTYKHQFTAYAALVQGTSVCQGYALLFYRLALELGVDARLISGTSRGEGHGWNIVKLGNKYYNADSTWDAGNTSYTYFLKCPSNFPDHTRNAEYETTDFHNAYPMASADYTPGTVCDHSYTASTQNATCTADGKTTYTCSKCGDSYSETIAKLGHDYTAETTEPTCTTDGVTVYTCFTCGHSYRESIPMLGHNYESEVFPPSCTLGGLTQYNCTRCDYYYHGSETPALGHSWDSGTVTKEPTETETGIRTFTCTRCQSTREESIPVIGQEECSHSYESVTREPTCSQDGETVYTCTKCGHSYSEWLQKTGHIYSETVTPPTCTEQGYTTTTCSGCDYSMDSDFVDATGHFWDEGTVTKQPTDTEAGIMLYTCTACGETMEEAIPVSCEHSYESIVTAPTCTEDGYTTHTCTKCGQSYKDSPVEATGHAWDEGYINQPPTETTDGWYEFTCTVCGEKKTETIPAKDSLYRISGSNRYETSIKAANLLLEANAVEKFGAVVVASGTGFADALSGSYLAVINSAPMLLVNKHTVQTVADYILKNTYSGSTVYILGGEAAVPAELDELLKNEFYVKRLAGANRYETNLKVLEETGIEGMGLCVCTGKDFADSLSVSALRRPILLVNKSLTDDQRAFLDTIGTNDIYVIGGESAVNKDIEEELANYGYGYVERISGANRYETSVKVAERFFPLEVENLVLAYGQNFPDGLCGGVLAYYLNAPMLLTRDKNAALAADFAAKKGVTTGAVLGGTSLISDASVRKIFSLEESDPITLR